MLGTREVLVAQEQHLVLQQQRANLGEQPVVARRVAKIHVDEFGAEVAGERRHVEAKLSESRVGQRLHCQRRFVRHKSSFANALNRSDRLRRSPNTIGQAEHVNEFLGSRPLAEARRRVQVADVAEVDQLAAPVARQLATRSKLASGSLRLAATMLRKGSRARGTGSQPCELSARSSDSRRASAARSPAASRAARLHRRRVRCAQCATMISRRCARR